MSTRVCTTAEHIDLPYVKDQGSSTLQLTGTATLSREPWKAQVTVNDTTIIQEQEDKSLRFLLLCTGQ